MFKRILLVFGVVGGILLFLSTLGFLYWKSYEPEPEVTTVKPANRDITSKTVATGSIVPRVEVELKSRVSGVIETLSVEAGVLLDAGVPIATVTVQPDAASLSNAQGGVRRAKIAADDARSELDRLESLYAQGAVSAAELERQRVRSRLADSDLRSASNSLTVVRDGAVRGSGPVATEVRSTVRGMVLDVPVEVGMQVTESNTFNAGTTIAVVADMTDMVFEGTVDESEVGRIREGMTLSLTVGAYRTQSFSGTLEYIAPKGERIEGSVQFAIRAALATPPKGVFLRAGSSANADIVLDSRQEVLTLPERVIVYDGGQPFIDVVEAGETVRRAVTVGLSDGQYTEVLSGVAPGDVVQQP